MYYGDQQKQTKKALQRHKSTAVVHGVGVGPLNNDLFSFKSVCPFILASRGVIPLAGFIYEDCSI